MVRPALLRALFSGALLTTAISAAAVPPVRAADLDEPPPYALDDDGYEQPRVWRQPDPTPRMAALPLLPRRVMPSATKTPAVCRAGASANGSPGKAGSMSTLSAATAASSRSKHAAKTAAGGSISRSTGAPAPSSMSGPPATCSAWSAAGAVVLTFADSREGGVAFETYGSGPHPHPPSDVSGTRSNMQLVTLAKNPIPGGAVVGELKGAGGVRLRFARWQHTRGARRGTVCLFQGRGEFIEKYFEVIADLRRRGFAVATLDWRGQGGSERIVGHPRKGHVGSFAEFDADLRIFMRDVVLPDCPPPFIALAHSMGGNILLRNAAKPGSWFDRMVLTAPMIYVSEERAKHSQRVTRLAAEVACLVGGAKSYVRAARMSRRRSCHSKAILSRRTARGGHARKPF